MKRLSCALALMVFALPAFAAKEKKAGRPKPPCGMSLLPFAPGDSYTYGVGEQRVVINVISVAPEKDARGKDIAGTSRIVVEETFGARKYQTEWTCNAEGMRIAPESFFFSGEPGGTVGMSFTISSMKDVTLHPDTALGPDVGWEQLIKGDIVRSASADGVTHAPVKVEMERYATVLASEALVTRLGQWPTTKIEFDLRGRAVIGEDKAEIVPKRRGAMYFVKGLGVVKIEDQIDKTWDLIETNVPLPK